MSVDDEYGAIEVVAPVLFVAPRQSSTTTSFGMVKGEVDALIRSKGRFVVFTEPDLRAVSCYIERAMDVDEVLPGLYGKRLRVTGEVERDRSSGRVLRVQRVVPAHIEVLPKEKPTFETALGVLRVPPGTPPPEKRRLALED